MGKKGGRYGKYGEQKRRERFQKKSFSDFKPQLNQKSKERWRNKQEK